MIYNFQRVLILLKADQVLEQSIDDNKSIDLTLNLRKKKKKLILKKFWNNSLKNFKIKQ